jgi:hypothetical protein
MTQGEDILALAMLLPSFSLVPPLVVLLMIPLGWVLLTDILSSL